MHHNRIAHTIALCAVIVTLNSSCAYRFTNRHVSTPGGIKSVIVEAVYDTSKEVLPHELLWTAIQKRIAKDGHLKLTSAHTADAIILAHLTQAKVGATGSITADPLTQDPSAINPETANASQFRNLKKAGESTSQERIQIGVTIKVIDLRTQKLLLTKRYTREEKFKSARAGSNPDSFFPIYDEALRHKFLIMSDSIATSLLGDLLIRR